MLTKAISTEEVITVVKELQPDKAPGPDGFQAFFPEFLANSTQGSAGHCHFCARPGN